MGKIRIIGGEWARRQLPVVEVAGLRPTSDRMRETLFNWLQNDLPGSRVLDAFAGTGALGLEALSRGAEAVVFVEKSSKAARQLKANLKVLQAENAQVVQSDVLRYLQQPPQAFEGVFIDPPFARQLQQRLIDILIQGAWLKPEGWVYVEQPKKQSLPQVPAHWDLHREKQAGEVRYLLYRFKDESCG